MSIFSFDEAEKLNYMKTVMVFGTFDLLHRGHINFLKQAKEYGDLIVVIARDKTVKRVKGKLPKYNESRRLKAILSLNLAATAVLGNLMDKYAVIVKFRPSVIALGYDQNHFTDRLAEKFKDIKIIRLKSFQPNKYKTSIIKYENNHLRQHKIQKRNAGNKK